MNAHPPNRALPESASSTISGSGSFQTHLSTTNSQQRLRATNVYPAKDSNSTVPSTLPVLSNPASRSWNGTTSKWMALVYCFLSFIFTSTTLYRNVYSRIPDQNGLVPSTLAFLSTEQRLSRISAQLGASRMFDPYLILGAPPTNVGITACVWTTDSEESIRSLVSWASGWSGPISLVMITTQEPRSVSHQQLIERLKTLQGHPSLSGLSLHLLHVKNNAHSPSAYLNLARLFANSPTVLLFPAHLSNVPSNFYEALNSHIHHPVRKPVLITSATASAFSIPRLTPVVLPRNYRLWCTERAFLASRATEWDDCLWQLWFEEYGLGQANITITFNTEDPVGLDADASGLTRRLSGKYRAELCEVAIKRLSTDAPRMSKGAKRKLQWVKNFCRQTENATKNSGA